MGIEIDLNWLDMYNDVIKGNITWDDFNEYLLNLTEQAYQVGYDEGYVKCQWDRT